MNCKYIDIIQDKDFETCSSRCSLQFDYGVGDCIIKNNNDKYISFIQYSPQLNKCVFNGVQYFIQSIRLYKKGFHSVGKNKKVPDCELFIHLTGDGKNLMICIPCLISNGISSSKRFFDQLESFPNTNETKTYHIQNGFTLNTLIPKSSFITYQDKNLIEPCDIDVTFIVFHNPYSWINMSNSTYNKLNIDSKKLKSNRTPSTIFLNKLGTTDVKLNSGEDDIYIDCHPVEETGDDEMNTQQLFNKKIPTFSKKTKEAKEYERKIMFFVIMFSSIILILLLFYVIYKFIIVRLIINHPSPSQISS